MAKKQKLVVNKMYEWELDVDGATRYFKCFVGEDECITYEDGREQERIPIVNKEQAKGVLQIDSDAKVFTGRVPFQLENGIPYIKLPNDEGEVKWVSSDTSKEERFQFEVRRVKKDAYMTAASGLAFLIGTLIMLIVRGTVQDWSILPVLGVFLLAVALMNMIRLKREVEAMGRYFFWTLK